MKDEELLQGGKWVQLVQGGSLSLGEKKLPRYIVSQLFRATSKDLDFVKGEPHTIRLKVEHGGKQDPDFLPISLTKEADFIIRRRGTMHVRLFFTPEALEKIADTVDAILKKNKGGFSAYIGSKVPWNKKLWAETGDVWYKRPGEKER